MTTLTIRRKALAKQEEVPQIPLTKVQAWLAAIVGRAFRRPASLPPCQVVFQHEQPDRRREITVLALLIDATDQLRHRDVAVASGSPSAHSRTHPQDSRLSCGLREQSNV